MADDDQPSENVVKIQRSVFDMLVLAPRDMKPSPAQLSEETLSEIVALAISQRANVSPDEIGAFITDVQDAANIYFACQTSGADRKLEKAKFAAIAKNCRALVSAYRSYSEAYVQLPMFARRIMKQQETAADLKCAEEDHGMLAVRVFRPPVLNDALLADFTAIADKSEAMVRKLSDTTQTSPSFQRAFVFSLGMTWRATTKKKPTVSRNSPSSFQMFVECVHAGLKKENPNAKIPAIGAGNLRDVADRFDEVGDGISI